MNLLDAFLRFSERSFRWNFRNTVAVLIFIVVFVTAVALYPAFYVALACSLGLLIALAILNRRAFMQLVFEGHGAQAFLAGRNAEAESYFRKSWALAQTLEPTDRSRGRILEWLVLVTQTQGNFDDAEAFAQEWLSNDEKTYGGSHLRTVAAMEALAQVYRVLARYPQALPLMERALRVRETRQDREPADYAACLETIGRLWNALERRDRAEPYLRRAFEIVQKYLASSSREALRIAGQYCVIRMFDRVDEAESIAQAARRNIPCHLSLETPMACGIGICFSCVTPVKTAEGWDYKRVCVEGPIFDATHLHWAE